MSISIAIVGAGMMGQIHAQAWSEQPGVRVTAVADPDQSLAEALAARFGAKAVPTALEALAGAQIVSICTPPYLHAEHVEQAAVLGVDILLEKPAAFTTTDYDRMQAAVDQSGVRLMVGMTGRFYPEGQAAMARVRNSTLGTLVAYAEHMHFDAGELPDWYFQRRFAGGGVLMTNGIHSIDRVLWLLRPREVRIVAATLRSLAGRGDVEDFADVLLDCDGVLCRVQLLWQTGAGATRAVELVGTQGTLRMELYRGFVVTGAAGQQEQWLYPEGSDFLERTCIGIRAEVVALLEARTMGVAPPSPLMENRRVFDLIRTIYQHARGAGNA